MRAFNLLAITFITSLSLSAFAGDPPSRADDGNVCDDLIEQGASKEDIAQCFKAFKKSKYRKYLEKQAADRGEQIAATKEEEERLAAEKEADRKKYIIKSFEGEEVKYLKFAHFVAVKYTDESMGSDETVDRKMSSPKELCEYLGFENAISDKEHVGYKLSERISDYENQDYKGIYVNWNNKLKEVKWKDSDPASVQHYTKIVCKRLRKSDEQVQSEVLQNAIRLVISAQEKPEVSREGEEQVDIERDESELMVRRLLESRRSGKRSADKFTHK